MATFLGIPYPITRGARGFFRTQSGIDQVKSDILFLLLSNFGERVMLPNYGTDLIRFVFEPNDVLLHDQVKNAISLAIRNWEPRVVISDINVTSSINRTELNSADDLSQTDSILLIRVNFFDPENIQSVQELTLEVPITG